MTWIDKDFEKELQLEQAQNNRELLDLEQDTTTPQWDFLEDDNTSGFYTGYHGTTLKQHAQGMRDLGFNY